MTVRRICGQYRVAPGKQQIDSYKNFDNVPARGEDRGGGCRN